MTDEDIPNDAQILELRACWAALTAGGNLDPWLSHEQQAHIAWALRAATQCIPFSKSGETIPGPPSALGNTITRAVEQFEASDPPEVCPHCGANLIGEAIPENRRHMFGNATHYSRLFAHCDEATDRCDYFECPDCHGRIER